MARVLGQIEYRIDVNKRQGIVPVHVEALDRTAADFMHQFRRGFRRLRDAAVAVAHGDVRQADLRSGGAGLRVEPDSRIGQNAAVFRDGYGHTHLLYCMAVAGRTVAAMQ